ncbi:hypothetical protein HPP92_007089 [Vanilla planifolia]|uniref:Protein TAR1 n=1 Tax=Vanilla planifolia TaxID=51239 RepID=A0A835RD72_VANPL|nr:hypothetical protein HPP92_007089 [Vanilla planifolia]
MRPPGDFSTAAVARAPVSPDGRGGQAPRAVQQTVIRRSASSRGAPPAPICFPPDNFKHSLTLFSKSFSSFPRGTCSLSVSRNYLALDGIYHPIWAAFPNNPEGFVVCLRVAAGVAGERNTHPPGPLSGDLIPSVGPGPLSSTVGA